MNSNSCGKGLAVFSLTLVLSVGIASLFVNTENFEKTELLNITSVEQESFVEKRGRGVSGSSFNETEQTSCYICKDGYLQKSKNTTKSSVKSNSENNNLKILSKPKPNYTDLAKLNNINGTVKLKIRFLANGQIGAVKLISGLPYGLTDEALKSAKEIKFEPATENGKAKSVTKVVEYNFTIY